MTKSDGVSVISAGIGVGLWHLISPFQSIESAIIAIILAGVMITIFELFEKKDALPYAETISSVTSTASTDSNSHDHLCSGSDR